jgi:hypothetical protein
MERDYLGEMNERISAALAESEHQPSRSVFAHYADTAATPQQPAPLVAHELAARLRIEDPELLAGWLQLRAAGEIEREIASRQRATRRGPQRAGNAAKFAAALEAARARHATK